ncbi:hypothetical protein MNEG_3788 [Monoraphidium neglectum]|uniref:Uncharacterized protein n=1 Tax=Monoraphidium neglectum TaxID=145388 RepID=A0A0D2MNA1_9CHLO|nr:hypothetical protein MNEG_3788 [Monoraphidium neglectum]KIZ04170.1 hypothetical protein MNEG_3788 [Monoraphidium neglectum]|eukprot:XP_013903189.1 hypothetical protein MNEG_3788 [Monoraphidium neglectum]
MAAVWEGRAGEGAEGAEGADGEGAEFRHAAVELPVACAYYLGKVLAHVGAGSWLQLSDTFFALASLEGSDEALNCLVSSFPAVAAVAAEALGEEVAQEELSPAIVKLLRTQLNTIAPALSTHLSEVARALSPQGRLQLLSALPVLALQPDPERAGDWRHRQRVVRQLPALSEALTQQQVAHCLWPVVVTLLHDPVAAVRYEAARQVGPLIARLSKEAPPPDPPLEAKGEAEGAAGDLTAAAGSADVEAAAAAAAAEPAGNGHTGDGAAAVAAAADGETDTALRGAAAALTLQDGGGGDGGHGGAAAEHPAAPAGAHEAAAGPGAEGAHVATGGRFGFREGLRLGLQHMVDNARAIPHVGPLVDAGTKVAGLMFEQLEGLTPAAAHNGGSPPPHGDPRLAAASAAAHAAARRRTQGEQPAPLVTEDAYARLPVPAAGDLLSALTRSLGRAPVAQRRALAAAACGALRAVAPPAPAVGRGARGVGAGPEVGAGSGGGSSEGDLRDGRDQPGEPAGGGEDEGLGEGAAADGKGSAPRKQLRQKLKSLRCRLHRGAAAVVRAAGPGAGEGAAASAPSPAGSAAPGEQMQEQQQEPEEEQAQEQRQGSSAPSEASSEEDADPEGVSEVAAALRPALLRALLDLSEDKDPGVRCWIARELEEAAAGLPEAEKAQLSACLAALRADACGSVASLAAAAAARVGAAGEGVTAGGGRGC